MKDSTSVKKSSEPSKSERAENARKRIKTFAEDCVERQLARRRAARDAKNGTNFDGSPLETAPAERETVIPVEKEGVTVPVKLELSLVEKKMSAKIRRAFRKAGKPDASPEEQAAFLKQLLDLKIPVLNRSSGRISRVIKGEQSIESLLLVRSSPEIRVKASGR